MQQVRHSAAPISVRYPVIACLAAALVAGAVADNWTNNGGNGRRNGQSTAAGPTAEDLLWCNTDDFSIISWHPYILDGRVFTIREAGFPQAGGSANDALVAYDIDTGAELWRRTLSFGGDTSQEWIAWIAGVNNSKVYASRSSHSQPQPIREFDAVSGAEGWESEYHTMTWAHDGVVFAPDGDLIVGDFNSVVRIDASDGGTVWETSRSCPVSGNCGVAINGG